MYRFKQSNIVGFLKDCMLFKIAFIFLLFLQPMFANANISGNWLDEKSNPYKLVQIKTVGNSEIEIIVSRKCKFRGSRSGDTFRTTLSANGSQELARCFKNQADMDSARRRPHRVTLNGKVTADELGIYIKLKMPNATEVSAYLNRAPKVLGMTVVGYADDELPPHPHYPALMVFLYGHYLVDANGQPREIESIKPFSQENPRPALEYRRLAHGFHSYPVTVNTDLARGIPEVDSFRRDRDRKLIKETWLRTWNSAEVGLRMTAGPSQTGHGHYGILLRVTPIGDVPAGQKKIRMGGLKGVSWTMPPFVSGPRKFCPRFLRQSIYEDFTNEWVDIENVAIVAGAPSILPNSLLSPSENRAGRLEAQIFRIPELLGERSASQSVAYACPNFPSLSAKKNRKLSTALVGEYYWSKRRLRDGIVLTLQNLVTLNKLSIMQCPNTDSARLGLSSLSARPTNRQDSAIPKTTCLNYDLAPGAKRICLNLKRSCRNDQNFAQEVERTSVLYHQHELIEKPYKQKLGSLQQLNSVMTMSGRAGAQVQRQVAAQATKLKAEIAKLKEAKEAVEAISSWVTQKKFRQVASGEYESCLANSGFGMCEELRPVYACKGMKAQALELESKLHGHLTEFTRALSCLEDKSSCDMDTETFRKTVAKAPILTPLALPSDTDSKLFSRTHYVNAQLGWAHDRRKLRRYADGINDALNDFYLSAGLTVATFGVGELALVARGISASVSSAQTARNALTLARVLEAAAIGSDFLVSGYEINRAIRRCTNIFAQTSQIQPSNYNVLEGPSCPSGSYGGPQIIEDYKACIVKAVTTEIAFGVLPGVPAAVRATIDTTTINSARRALNRTNPPFLNGPQRNAIIELFSRRASKMGPDELADAVVKLERAGFSKKQILDIVEELAPDLLVTLSPRLRRLEFAEAVLGNKKLTPQQADAIMDAHNASPLREKIAILRAKNSLGTPLFDKKQREALIRNYVCGDNGEFVRNVIIKVDDLPAELKSLRELLVKSEINQGDLADLIDDFDRVLFKGRQFQKENRPDKLVDLVKENAAKGLYEQIKRLPVDTAIELRAYLGRTLKKPVITSFSGNDFTKIDRRSLGFVDIPKQIQTNARQGQMLKQFRQFFADSDFSDLKSFEADHIVPVSDILRMDGFAKLKPASQREVLHNVENFQSLPKFLNGLKSNLTIGEWNQRMIDRGLGALPLEYVQDFIEKEKKLRAALQEQIRSLP